MSVCESAGIRAGALGATVDGGEDEVLHFGETGGRGSDRFRGVDRG